MTPPGWRIDESIAATVEVVRAAVGEVGSLEDPPHSNRGPRVDLYTGCTLPTGEPGPKWCVAFCRWAYRRAGYGTDVFPDTLSVSGLYEWAQARGKLVHAGALHAGDVFLLLGEGPNGDEHHHAGLVTADLGNGTAACCEGNHGDRVAATVRAGGMFSAIVRVVG